MAFPVGMMIYSSISACASYLNTSRNIKNQNHLAALNREYQETLERNRQDFQIEMHYKNVDLQKQIAKLNHEFRIDEQQVNYQNLIKQTEWQFFLQNWPLTVAPTVIRDEAYISKIGDSKVIALRVILAKSQDEYFNKFVLPSVEHNLQSFVNKNYPQMGSHPIVYYSGGWKTNSSSGGAAYSNLRYALNGLPTLIITPTVINEKIHIDVAIWGLGSHTSYQDTLFTLTFKRVITDNNKVDTIYCEALAESIRLHFNYITGWIADSYYLIEYNLMPLLPTIVSQDSYHERYQELKSFFSSRYMELYEMVLGQENNNLPINDSYTRKMKMCLLPEMSLNYAKSVVPLSKSEELSKFLTDSIESWLYLRTKEEVSWKSISDIIEYFSIEDLDYLQKLKEILILINDEENCLLLENVETKLISESDNEYIDLVKKTASSISDSLLSMPELKYRLQRYNSLSMQKLNYLQPSYVLSRTKLNYLPRSMIIDWLEKDNSYLITSIEIPLRQMCLKCPYRNISQKEINSNMEKYQTVRENKDKGNNNKSEYSKIGTESNVNLIEETAVLILDSFLRRTKRNLIFLRFSAIKDDTRSIEFVFDSTAIESLLEQMCLKCPYRKVLKKKSIEI